MPTVDSTAAAPYPTMSAHSQKPKRLLHSEVRISICDESDSEGITAGLYASFPESWWAQMEPPSIRPPLQATRVTRLANRLVRPSFSLPHVYWVKAVYIPTNAIIGAAGWAGPGAPIHNFWRHSAAQYYNWFEKFNWSEEEFKEMWAGVDLKAWEEKMGSGDKIREEVMGDEPHWYLAPLYTLPEFQGRGVGGMLLDWAIERADATTPYTPMYLESSPAGRPVYQRKGFVPIGKVNFLRRGPVSEGLVKVPSKEKGPTEKEYVAVEVQEVSSVAAK